MTNMHDCIDVAMRAGELTADQGKQAQIAYAKLRDRYATFMTPGQAAARAAEDMKRAVPRAERARFHKVVNQLQAMRRIRHQVESTAKPQLALTGFLRQAEGHGFKGESIQSLTEAYEDLIRSRLSEVLDEVGLGVTMTSRNTARLENLVKELHGEASGDVVAKGLAKAVDEVQRMMVRSFNAQGGDIKLLANRGMSQSHDIGQLSKAGFDDWAGSIEKQLAWDRIDDLTTGRPFADAPGRVPPRAETQRFLRDVYDSIVTRGWDDREPAMTAGAKALYNTRADHRVLHFKNGTAQLAYNRDFGGSDPFSGLMNNLNGMARDVAMMRVLGPSPKMGLEYAIQVATKRAADLGNAKLAAQVRVQAARARSLFAGIDGAASVPESIAMANVFSDTRAFLASSQLGGAVFSSLSDVATLTIASHSVGMNARNVLSRSVQLLFSHATRETAARMGFVAEVLADTGGGTARYFGKMMGTGLPQRLAGFTLRASGLTVITDTRKVAFQMEFAGFMAENAAKNFDQIEPLLRKFFDQRGISAANWDALRAPEVRFIARNGADFISPIYWLEVQTAMPRAEAEGLAMRLQMATREKLELGMPTKSPEGMAAFHLGTAPGTPGGELLRSATGYKSFTMSLMLGQYRHFAAMDGNWTRAKYAAKMSGLMMLTGALVIQLNELRKGNDPRPMNSTKFWLAAALQSGGLGIFGDFFASEQSRAGGGIAETVAGPVVGLISDVAGPVASNLTAALTGKDTYLARDMVNFLRANTPVMSSMWWARTAYSRLVADELQLFLDPQAESVFRRQVKKMQADYGTTNYIPRPGLNQKIRLPNLSNALGGKP